MRLRREPTDVADLRAEIARAARAQTVVGRVCGETCNVVCPHCGATTCQCVCSPYCPDAARALSSDPDAHPIEPGIVALVYAMTQLQLFAPCWSCEGHARPDGSHWKLPAVWFYCDSTVHVRLLADGLAKLSNASRLSVPWRIAVTFSDPDNVRTTFSLEPALPADNPPSLQHLQRDADEIARALQPMMIEASSVLQRAGEFDPAS